jgi:uncharacterized protein
VVKVKVMEVDVARARIGLTMRLDETPAPAAAKEGKPKPQGRPDHASSQRSFGDAPPKSGSLGALLMKAGVKK